MLPKDDYGWREQRNETTECWRKCFENFGYNAQPFIAHVCTSVVAVNEKVESNRMRFGAATYFRHTSYSPLHNEWHTHNTHTTQKCMKDLTSHLTLHWHAWARTHAYCCGHAMLKSLMFVRIIMVMLICQKLTSATVFWHSASLRVHRRGNCTCTHRLTF